MHAVIDANSLSKKSKARILTIFGTRPEAIKLAPVIIELEKMEKDGLLAEQVVCMTGQHREMLDMAVRDFYIQPDYDLDIMQEKQSLEQVTSKVLNNLKDIFIKEQPSLIVVQGDTTTTLAAGLAAFYHQIPIAHVEAGLRTNNKYNPFPEEMNRRLISHLADLHFAPTKLAAQNLTAEGIAKDKVFTTGNTVIDALLWITGQNKPIISDELKSIDLSSKKTILVTTHRRENIGGGMEAIFSAIARLVKQYDDVRFVFPVHLNPLVRKAANNILRDLKNIHLIEPVSYTDLAHLLNKCYFVMTDSGGIQEEAPALGKPVIVLRSTTERPEGVEAGTAMLAGVDEGAIFSAAKELIEDQQKYEQMSKAVSPYGDGKAATRIAKIIKSYL